jgi:D-alanyl-D-alanine carboxypeptidase/D-alanyl-D-alanine-endopeptidase (penicillin-binding protein 4)
VKVRQLAVTATIALVVMLVTSADARPPVRKPLDPKKLGSSARVNYGRELRPTREVTGRKTSVLTDEEDAAAKIQALLRGPLLRRGVTGLFVADARTGEPLFAVNADDPLNPASNVKMISTATALDLLGASFRYPTRVLGPDPIAGTIKGDIYLLGSHDPTLAYGDFDQLAQSLAKRGITTIDGSIATGGDPTRDGIFRATVPVEILAGEPGAAPVINLPAGFELVTIKNTATTAKRAMRPRLTYKVETSTTPTGQPRIELSIGGTIGKDGKLTYPLSAVKLRTATAAYALRAALKSHKITITGEWKTRELGDFVGDAVARGALPVELGRHESIPLADIAARVNKWSINWLADRLVVTAAGLAKRQPPTMALAIDAMYTWLDRHPHVPRKSVVLDTGSGLSYRTQISSKELVSVVRSAGGFMKNADVALASTWRNSLSIAGTDGTLRYRFRTTPTLGGRILGKTGTLSTVIALSGILDLDPNRPLAFALVTNTDAPLSKNIVRKAHEQVIAELCKYLAKTSRAKLPAPAAPKPIVPAAPDEGEETDDAIDHEAAGKPVVPPVKRPEELPL